ncbi:MAG: adenine phosphoribosyltransferase [Deltaproteobacteria bacterium]|nr:MAG: adenine phosphoribosyltransferase [Deltaproteobacteria bacterium]
MQLSEFVRDIPDFPKPGIVFKDITPLLRDARAWRAAIDQMKERLGPMKPDLLLGIESRGFLFAGALAAELGLGLIIARKPGKLPYHTDSVSYDLEYGSATLELHTDAVDEGQRVVIIDDLLATGGTAAACSELVRRQKGQVAGYLFCIELAFLEGRKKLSDAPVEALIAY